MASFVRAKEALIIWKRYNFEEESINFGETMKFI